MASVDTEIKGAPKDERSRAWRDQPLDKSLLNLDPEELAFFKESTGIQDEAELKEHICTVQAEANAVFPYTCIRNFNFTKLKISRLPAYPHVLQLVKEKPDALLLDLGCCFGNDARKAIRDGYPMKNVIASDLRREFWELGHKLFRDTADSFPVPFIGGDVFDPSFLSPDPISLSELPPSLDSLKALTPLKSSISVIHASSFFHLFDEQHQARLAKLVGSLISTQPGSIIFGSHVGAAIPSIRDRGFYAHSPESWKELWESVLGEMKCRVEASIRKRERHTVMTNGIETNGLELQILTWSVTVL